MKKIYVVISLLLMFLCYSNIYATEQKKKFTMEIEQDTLYKVTTYNDIEYVGKIVFKSPKEIVINTKKRGEISIPMFHVKEIKIYGTEEEVENLYYITNENLFKNKYVIFGNAYSMPKDNGMIAFQLLGINSGFGITDNLDINVVTSYLGFPFLLSTSYAFAKSDYINFSASVYLGTAGWELNRDHFILPNITTTVGTPDKNLSISLLYLFYEFYGKSDPAPGFIIGGNYNIVDRLDLVFEGLYFPNHKIIDNVKGYFVPSIRYRINSDYSVQFGLLYGVLNDKVDFARIPVLQFMMKF